MPMDTRRPARAFAAPAAFAALLASATGAQGADADGHFAIKDAGAQTCGKFLTAWTEGTKDVGQYAGWIAGYVTAINQQQDGLYDLTPWQTTETLLGMTRSVCGQVPEETRFLDAFAGLIKRISPTRLTAKSELEGVRRGDQAAIIYKVILAEARIRLARAGHPSGDPNAPFDDVASNAFLAFQQAEGLPTTGLPDQQTLFALFMENGEAESEE